MAINTPTADFVTSSLVDAINASVDTLTIAAGLTIPATNGALQIDYDSAIAVGTASGPETILYATYTTATGIVAGVTRGAGGTTGVTHDALASVQCGDSSVYYGALNALYDGWIPVTEVWTRTSNTAYTITGDFTSVLSVGDKLKVTDTTTKYFNITAISYSAPDTTVTITGGSDYVLAATPTVRYYSKSLSPVGFPSSFAYGSVFYKADHTTSLAGSPNPARFRMKGAYVTGEVSSAGLGDPAGAIICFSLPVAINAASGSALGFSETGAGAAGRGGGLVGKVTSLIAGIYKQDEGNWPASSNAFQAIFGYEV